MSERTTPREDNLTSFVERLGAVTTTLFATGDVTTLVLHFQTDAAMGMLPLFPLPGLDAAPTAHLVVGLYDPPVAAVLAEGWATNLTLPREINEALDGKRPWSIVRDQIETRVAPALRRYPALAEALRNGDVATLNATHRQALTYAWHDATMGPVVRGDTSLRDLPASMRRKIMILFSEDRRGHSQTRLWRIEERGGQRHFVPEPLEGADEFATRWRPLYLAWEMAARAGVPMTLVCPRVRDLCREQLQPYKLVDRITFTDVESFFRASHPSDHQ